MPTSGTPTKVFLHCQDPATARWHMLSAIGVNTLFGRWGMLPAAISDLDPCSLNVQINDFRGESDLALLRDIPGVLEVRPFDASIQLPDPVQARREHFLHAAHA